MSASPERLPLSVLPFAVALVDAKGRLLEANHAFERLTGLEQRADDPRDLFARLASSPGMAAVRKPYLEGSAVGGVNLDFETTFGGREGTPPQRFRATLTSFQDGKRALGFLALIELPPSDEDRRRLEEAVRLAAHVQHQLNNPLMGLLGHVELLLGMPDLDDAVRRRAETISVEAARIRERVTELGAIRRLGGSVPEKR
jgi:signal transduction histidine kinase